MAARGLAARARRRPRPGPARGRLRLDPLDDRALPSAPVLLPDAYTAAEDTTLSVPADQGLLANDTDPDGDPLTATLLAPPAGGTVAVRPDGSFTFTPDPNFYGTQTFSYTVSNDTGESAVGTVTVTVTPVNDIPTFTLAGDPPAVDEDAGPQTVAHFATAISADPSGVFVVTGNSNPALFATAPDVAADGTLTYTPAPDMSGTAQITVVLLDDGGTADGGIDTSRPQTFTITVRPLNDAPTVAADAYVTDQNSPLTVTGPGVLANDTEEDGDPLTATLVFAPAGGTVQLDADGSFAFTPRPAFRGTYRFTYRVTDPTGAAATGTVTIRVIPPSGAPVALDDPYTVTEDGTLSVPAAGVLANDTPPGNLPLAARLVSGPGNGTVTLNADGSFVYTPDPDFFGTDSFSYKAEDVNKQSGSARVRITVTPVNDRPTAIADLFITDPDAALSGNVLANDRDPDGDPLAAALVSGPANGTVVLSPDGSFVYTPAAGFLGTDTFSYQATDGVLTSNLVRVTIVVRSPAGPPRPDPDVPPPPVDPGPPPADGKPDKPPGPGPHAPPGSGPVIVAPPAADPDWVPISTPSGPPAFAPAIPPAAPPPDPVLPAAPVLPPLPGIPSLPAPAVVVEGSPAPILVPPPLAALPLLPRVLPPAAEQALMDELGQLAGQVNTGVQARVVADVVVATGVAATAGYVFLTPRLLVWLLGGLLARRAVWKPFDPLEVVYAWEKDKGQKGPATGDDESLESMVGK